MMTMMKRLSGEFSYVVSIKAKTREKTGQISQLTSPSWLPFFKFDELLLSSRNDIIHRTKKIGLYSLTIVPKHYRWLWKPPVLQYVFQYVCGFVSLWHGRPPFKEIDSFSWLDMYKGYVSMSAVRLELWVNLLFPIATMATGFIFM